jgi:hypothetical protein
MAVAETERAFDRCAASVALHAVGAEPETGQADSLDLQIFHHGFPYMNMSNRRRHVADFLIERLGGTAGQ